MSALKRFSAEGRFECGLDAVVKGKVWAFVAVFAGGGNGYGQFALGVAIANEGGYAPIPPHWCHGDSFDEMSAHADALNLAEGLTERGAALIVCSTMGGRHMK